MENPPVKLSWLTSAEQGAKLLVAAAVAVNVVGFMVVTVASRNTGMPVFKMPLLVFTAAGCGFALYTVIAGWFALHFAAGRHDRWRLAVLYGLIVFSFAMGMLSNWRLMVFLVFETLGIWAFYPRADEKPWRLRTGHPVSYLVIFPLMVVTLFASYVYPTLPRAFGGGEPQPVILDWVTRPPWANDDIRLFELYSDERTLYLVAESRPGMNPVGARLGAVPRHEGRVQYLAVDRSRVDRIMYLPSVLPWAETPSSPSGVVGSSSSSRSSPSP
jgi:hypothetical protein